MNAPGMNAPGLNAPGMIGDGAGPLRVPDLAATTVCFGVLLLNLTLGVADNSATLLLLTLAMLVSFAPYYHTSFGATALFCGMTIFVVPTYSLLFVDAGVSTAWVAMFILVARVIMGLSGDDRRCPPLDTTPTADVALIVIILATGLATQAAGLTEQFFHAAWAISLIHLERLHAATRSTVWRLVGLALVLGGLGLYSAFFWSGFGRLILSTFALAPILICLLYGTFRINYLLFAAGSAGLVFFGRVVRFGVSDGIAGLAVDSGASPITFSQTLWDGGSTILYREPIWHQWSLLFLNWFPRGVWPDKPISINSWFVDEFIGRAEVGLEHTTSVGFFGEHFFIAPTLWFVSIALLTLVVVLMIRTLRWFCAPFAAPVVVLNAWMISLFWGGMSVYGSRVWFSLGPMVIYILVFRRLLRRAEDRESPSTVPPAALPA